MPLLNSTNRKERYARMNSLIYFILLTFVYGLYRLGCWYYIRNVKVLRVMFSDYHSIVKYSEVLKNKPLSELPYRSIETNNFSAEFAPNNPLDFFVQLDDIYATINSKYEAIMNWGILIEEEDLYNIELSFKQVEDIHYSVINKRFLNFGKE